MLLPIQDAASARIGQGASALSSRRARRWRAHGQPRGVGERDCRQVMQLGWGYVDVDPFAAGVLTIGFIFGAYMSETFRGAILAVPRGEIEAGQAFGMSPRQVFRHITLPASMRHALPGLGNNWLVLVKTTALVSVIGLQDMLYKAGQAGAATREPFSFYLAVALLFLPITSVSELLLHRLARRFGAGVRRS